MNAQEYDSLNLLAKIPKTSELYQVKLKQYQELSKLRDEYKKEAQQKRIDKMKREFEYEKKIMEKEMQNAIWVDENRKMMLAQQINIVKNQEQWQKDQDLLDRQAIMQKQQQFMANTQNSNPNANPYMNQSPNINQPNANPYMNQSPNINQNPHSTLNGGLTNTGRIQSPQNGHQINSSTSLANGN